jgi:hypothetical protein
MPLRVHTFHAGCDQGLIKLVLSELLDRVVGLAAVHKVRERLSYDISAALHVGEGRCHQRIDGVVVPDEGNRIRIVTELGIVFCTHKFTSLYKIWCYTTTGYTKYIINRPYCQ